MEVPLTPAEEVVMVALTHFARQGDNAVPSGRIASWLNTRVDAEKIWTSYKVGAVCRGLRKMGYVVPIDSFTMQTMECVKPGIRVLWRMVDPPERVHSVRSVNIYLTERQCLYLAGELGLGAATDTVITDVDDVGGIFVMKPSDLDEEGAGVWVDAAGNEHYGPGFDFKELDIDWRTQMAKRRAIEDKPSLGDLKLEIDPLGEMEKLQGGEA